MPDIRQPDHNCQQETDEEPPLYIPRCLTEYFNPSIEEA